MSTSIITVRLDEKLKGQFEEIVNDLGLNMTTAIAAFIKAVVREEAIPFNLSRKKNSFYSPANMAALKESIEQHKRGEVVTFSNIEELEKATLKAKKGENARQFYFKGFCGVSRMAGARSQNRQQNQ